MFFGAECLVSGFEVINSLLVGVFDFGGFEFELSGEMVLQAFEFWVGGVHVGKLFGVRFGRLIGVGALLTGFFSVGQCWALVYGPWSASELLELVLRRLSVRIELVPV